MFRFVFQTLALVLLASAVCKGSAGSFGGERIAFQTRLGDVVIALYPEIAPASSQHILNVAAAGLYTTNTLSAAEGRKVILTGSCLSDRRARLNPVHKHLVDKQLPLEVDTRLRHSAGEVSVATLDAANATNRLMFMLQDTAAFDTKQTVVGHVITGMDVLREIATLGDRQDDVRATSEHVSIDSVYIYSAVDVGPQPHPIHMARGVERESAQKQETFFWSACAACHRQTVEINKRLHAARMVLREARLGQKKGPYSSSWAAQLGYRQKTALLPPEL